MRFLVVAEPNDVSALRVCAHLRRRHGPAQVLLACPHALALSCWKQCVDQTRTRTTVRLPDGRLLDDTEIDAVFNRLTAITLPQYAHADSRDREYAQFEMQALIMSWLMGLRDRVVNPPAPPSLAGPQRSQTELLVAAGRAGMRARSVHTATSARTAPAPRRFDVYAAEPSQQYHAAQWQPRMRGTLAQSPMLALEPMRGERRELLLAGSRVLGSPDADVTAACMRLGDELGCHLLRIVMDRARTHRGEWCVTDVSPLPLLEREDEVALVVALLEARAAEGVNVR